MILVKTTKGPSAIQGTGLFAAEFIPKGTVMWVWKPGDDRTISEATLKTLPSYCQRTIRRYSWKDKTDGLFYLCGDDAVFINHSKNPNFADVNGQDIALRDIQIGEEITGDYSTFDANYGNPEFGYDWNVEE